MHKDLKQIGHFIGREYNMIGDNRVWKISYYPIESDNKTKEVYKEPRCLIETPIKNGIDFREVPLRYLKNI